MKSSKKSSLKAENPVQKSLKKTVHNAPAVQNVNNVRGSQTGSNPRNSFADILKKPSIRIDVDSAGKGLERKAGTGPQQRNQDTAAPKSFADVLKRSDEKSNKSARDGGQLKGSKTDLSQQTGGWSETVRVKKRNQAPSQDVRPQLLTRSNSTSHSQGRDSQSAWSTTSRPTFMRSNSTQGSTTLSDHQRTVLADVQMMSFAEKTRPPSVIGDGGCRRSPTTITKRSKVVRHHPNRISADTFHKIGLSTETEKYVMTETVGSRLKSGPRHVPPPHMEVEFRSESPQGKSGRVSEEEEDEEIEIEFVDPDHVDKFVNKISAGTYKQIGNSDQKKYVMSQQHQSNNLDRISEMSKTEQLQPVLRDIHDMIKEKMKRGEELTVTEREVLRQKRRDRRRREKETKRRLKEEEKRHQILFNSVSKQIRLISADLLNKVKGDEASAKKKTETLHQQRRQGIRFQDEEYPDLGSQSQRAENSGPWKTLKASKQQEHVLKREVRDSKGHLISDQDTGSEWETDFSDDGKGERGRGRERRREEEGMDKTEESEEPSKAIFVPESALNEKQRTSSASKRASKSTTSAQSRTAKVASTSTSVPTASRSVPTTSRSVLTTTTTTPTTASQPLSYSAILKKVAPAPAEVKLETSSGTAEKSSKKGKQKEKPVEVEQPTVKKKVKSKDPVVVDLLAFVQQKKRVGKGTKQAAVLSGKLAKEKSKKVGNLLDSTAPLRRRGKEREGGKKKKLTAMKKIILAEKSRKKLAREEAAARREARIKDCIRLQPLTPTDKDENEKEMKENEEEQEKDTKDSKQSIETSTTTGNLPNTSADRHLETGSCTSGKREDDNQKKEDNILKKEGDIETHSSNEKQVIEDKSKEVIDKENREESVEDRAKKTIHSRKYRDYCNQDISKDLDTYVNQLMSDIVRFQDRAFANDPTAAKLRKRYTVGLRETVKFLKVKKVACVLLAPDLDRISSDGGLDCTVDSIKNTCDEQSVPVVYTLNRYKLGKCCARKVPVSCIAILNRGFQGSDENYKNMLELSAQLKESYAARLKIEIENLEAEMQKNKIKPLRYVPGMEFVPNKPASVHNKPASVHNKPASVLNKPASVLNKPASVPNKPASVLKYSPGKEFVPRSVQQSGAAYLDQSQGLQSGQDQDQEAGCQSQQSFNGYEFYEHTGWMTAANPQLFNYKQDSSFQLYSAPPPAANAAIGYHHQDQEQTNADKNKGDKTTATTGWTGNTDRWNDQSGNTEWKNKSGWGNGDTEWKEKSENSELTSENTELVTDESGNTVWRDKYGNTEWKDKSGNPDWNRMLALLRE